MNKELRNCPFCGGEAEFCRKPIKTNGGWCDAVYVWCPTCEARSNRVLYNAKVHQNDGEYIEAAEAWNRREPIDRIVEQLEEKVIDCKEAFEDAMDDRSRDECIAIRSLRGGLEEAIEIVRGGYEEVYREEYDTAGNYHTWGTQSGHTVVKKGGAV